ncbi:ribose 5-phosphate isomerase A [Conexibacter sp. SYSU D00693]|uniref:ribose 5-phosphate isomerase A n=1 Tax=Conexibacter sp. SYSU D00693 TaxID=2812560 RepID=UPI00196A28E4|nr:ribose 5-phosphate isomerase A [Conexibacter sp. SYSU D00693]
MIDVGAAKRAAAEQAAELVQDGQRVGLGTGSTVEFLLPALAARGLTTIRCVATSPQTERQARELGLHVEPFDALDRLDVAIDGADQVAPDGWLVKGGGGAHLREKVVAQAAAHFVVIVDESKVVDALTPPVPLELRPYGLQATLHLVGELGKVVLRDAPTSPDGGLIADLHADVADPAALAARLDELAGVSAHGLFAPAPRQDVVVGR